MTVASRWNAEFRQGVVLMNGLLAAAGTLALCLMLVPLSGWWIAARLRGDSLIRFSGASLAGATTLGLVEMAVYALHLPQWVTIILISTIILASGRNLLSAIRSESFAWDGLLAWGGAAAILVAATAPYAVHGFRDAVWDWYEHWLCTLVFLKDAPVTTGFAIYTMPSRGPLFNAAGCVRHGIRGIAALLGFSDRRRLIQCADGTAVRPDLADSGRP